jgi:hypothetical protein
MPSAQEVEKNGVNLGEMNKLLVKKVEELTLYLIEKDKQVADQHSVTQLQQSQLAGQQLEIVALKQQVEDGKQSVQISTQQKEIDELKRQVAELLKKYN